MKQLLFLGIANRDSIASGSPYRYRIAADGQSIEKYSIASTAEPGEDDESAAPMNIPFAQIITPGLLKLLLPLACRWVEDQERRIVRDGVPLSASQLMDARHVGIQKTERVRMLTVDTVPLPMHPLMQGVAAMTGLISRTTVGLSLRYGIYLRSTYAQDRRLLVHEMVHTAQYERLGLRPFLKQYLQECLTVGYPLGELEQEAQRIQQEICP